MEQKRIQFVIDGEPVRQDRARRGKYGNWYDPSHQERKALSVALLYARQGAKSSILKGDVRLIVNFHIGPKKGRKPDLSNYIKAFEDSGNELLWHDDSQIKEINACLIRNSERPRTEVEIQLLS